MNHPLEVGRPVRTEETCFRQTVRFEAGFVTEANLNNTGNKKEMQYPRSRRSVEKNKGEDAVVPEEKCLSLAGFKFR